MNCNSDFNNYLVSFLNSYCSFSKPNKVMDNTELCYLFSENKYGFFNEGTTVEFIGEDDLIEQVSMFITYNNSRNFLISSNLRFVINFVRQIVFNEEDYNYLDLIQAGNIGLINAIDRFDINKGTKLSTYADFWVKCQINEYFHKFYRTIRFPVYVNRDIKKVEEAERRLQFRLKRNPTYQEIALELGWNFERVEELKILNCELESLCASVGDDDDYTLLDTIGSFGDFVEDYICCDDKGDVLESLICELDDKKRAIIKMYYGLGCEPMVFEKIAKVMGVSYQAVQQQHSKALKLLKEKCKEKCIENKIYY